MPRSPKLERHPEEVALVENLNPAQRRAVRLQKKALNQSNYKNKFNSNTSSKCSSKCRQKA